MEPATPSVWALRFTGVATFDSLPAASSELWSACGVGDRLAKHHRSDLAIEAVDVGKPGHLALIIDDCGKIGRVDRHGAIKCYRLIHAVTQ